MTKQKKTLRKALFIDRDGVINYDKGHVYKIEDFEFIEGIFNLIKFFQTRAYLIIIITNQAGIGKNIYTAEDFDKVTHWMISRFYEKGITINDVFYCPHTREDKCNCRKPKPGLFKLAIAKYRINPKESFMIGDKMTDMTAAKLAKVRFTYMMSSPSEVKSVYLKIIEDYKNDKFDLM